MANRIIHIGPVEAFKPGLLRLDKLQALKVLEECAETVEAYKDWYKHGKTPGLRAAMVDEMADLIQSMANLITVADITDGELADAMTRCRERNERRGRFRDMPADATAADEWEDAETVEFAKLNASDRKAAARA